MRDRANQFSNQYQHNYSILATPAEGLSGKFTRVDRKKFGTCQALQIVITTPIPTTFRCTINAVHAIKLKSKPPIMT